MAVTIRGRDMSRAMTTRLSALLFPPAPRDFPGRRALKIALRAGHVLSAGILTGLHVVQAGEAARADWLMGTLASGVLILLLDLHESGVFLLQVRGLVVVGKVAILAMLPLWEGQTVLILAGLVVASVLSSHAPSTVRYCVLAGKDRFNGAETKG